MGFLDRVKLFVSTYSWLFKFAGIVVLMIAGAFSPNWIRALLVVGGLLLLIGGAFKNVKF